MSRIIGTDIGGTFTDCVVVDADGEMTVSKAFSTPGDFAQGVIDAIRAQPVPFEELLASTSLFLHATSIAENAIVDTTLTPAGLVVTRGFEDALAMTRGGYGRWSGLTEEAKKDVLRGDKPRPIVPRARIAGVAERVDAAGRVVAEASEEEVEAAVRMLLGQGAQAIGACFLWSFKNPHNEEVVRRVLDRVCPETFSTLSSELSPLEGEYERASTVALNVSLGPVVKRYLGRLRQQLLEHGYDGPILVMQAHGGLVAVEEAPPRSVAMIESGPVGGLIGSAAVGELCGFPNILAADMGGTTFKVGVVRNGRIEADREPSALRYHYNVPKLEIVSIGMAGGSIVSVDPASGIPKVGPRSAGASPGPVCYGFGGDEPTITDVDAILGYLDPRFFLGGSASLGIDAARQLFAEKVAGPLGMETMEAAAAVQRLANSMMYDLLHKQTVEKGLDPSEYVLLSYGGSAGMHMTAVAPELGVRQVVVPHSASVQGAFGLVNADIVHSETVTNVVEVGDDAVGVLNELFDRLRDRVARRAARHETSANLRLERSVAVRFMRQVHSITVPVPGEGPITGADMEEIGKRFAKLYSERYGPEAGYREAGIEMVSVTLRGVVPFDRPHVRSHELGDQTARLAYVESRPAYLGTAMTESACYDFARLGPGNLVPGPAIVWSPITTVVVHPGQELRCDEYMNMVVTWGGRYAAHG